MYKYVKEFTQPLRDFDYSSIKQTNISQDCEDELEEALTKDTKLKNNAFLQDSGDYIETVTCTLCDKEITNNRQSVLNHEKSKGHQRKLAPVRNDYKKIKKFFKKFVLSGKKPVGKGLRRLKYYRLIMNYRNIEDLQRVM